MLKRETKKEQIDKLSKNLSRSKASFLVDYTSLNVEKMTALRKNLKQSQGDIQIIRNTLSLLAIEKDEKFKLAYQDQLDGPNAFVLAFDDVSKVAKIVDEFDEDNDIFRIKAGLLDGVNLTSKEIKILAKIPSLEVLRTQFLGILEAPLSKFLATIKEIPQGFVRVLESKREKKDS